MGEKRGSIAFFTTYRPPVALDIYSCPLPPKSPHEELRMTNGKSQNYDGHSIPPAALKLIIKRPKLAPEGIRMLILEDVYPRSDGVRMEDSPCIAGVKRDTLVYISTKEPAPRRRQPWTVVYKTNLKTGKTDRLTPSLQADLSPSVSPSGKRIAVASYQKKAGWAGEIQDLKNSIYVMNVEKPFMRRMVVENGGWPTWGSENVLFFHRKVDDFWAVFRVEFTDTATSEPTRVTSDKSNSMTPLAINATTVAVSMIRDLAKFGIDRTAEHYRHIIVFDSNTKKPVMDVTQSSGWQRTQKGENIEKQFHKIQSPVQDVGLFRLSGVFPTFSKDGKKVPFVDNEFKSVWVADDKDMRKVYEMDVPGKIFSPLWNQNKDKDILESGATSTNCNRGRAGCDDVSRRAGRSDDQINARMSRVERSSVWNAKRKARRLKVSQRSWKGKGPQKKLIHDFDDVATETKQKKETSREKEDIPRGHDERGSQISTRSGQKPASSEARSTSVLDRVAFTRDKPPGVARKDFKLDAGFFAIYLVNPDPKHSHVIIRVFGSGDDYSEHVNHPFFSPDGGSIVVTADLAGISVDPISLPLVEHSARVYGDIFSVDIDKNDINKNKDVKDFKRITHTRYENSTATWTMFSTDDPNAAWNLQFKGKYTPGCPHVPSSGAESWHMTGHLCIPKRCC
ncbi:hypothetical protein AgCh_026149 [Apium graveolens]